MLQHVEDILQFIQSASIRKLQSSSSLEVHNALALHQAQSSLPVCSDFRPGSHVMCLTMRNHAYSAQLLPHIRPGMAVQSAFIPVSTWLMLNITERERFELSKVLPLTL